MKTVTLIHFHPIEQYPPVMNFIRYWESRHPEKNLLVCTTHNMAGLPVFQPGDGHVTIKRLDSKKKTAGYVSRAIRYASFYGGTIWSLFRLKPETIFYYETISSFPAICYKKYVSGKVKLFVHYHEYTSPKENEEGMRLTRRFHGMEVKIYPVCEWVSHTNEDRMKRFLADHTGVSIPNHKILPNYPPKSWFRKKEVQLSVPVKLVYIGALSLDSMFARELAAWVLSQQGKLTWDIYASNITGEAGKYFERLEKETGIIHLHKGVDYYSLPEILKDFDVGVIIYKGHILNYVYNVPNKLLEYHSCGLDVWFPVGMISSLPLETHGTYPKIKAIDFTTLENLSIDNLIDRTGEECKQIPFFAEDAFRELYAAIND